MTPREHAKDDPFSRVDYRRMVAWPERLKREAPLLRRLAAGAPDASVIDLGCGTGEHSRFFAAEGYRAVGLDRSEAMLEKATDTPLPPNLRFVLGEIEEAPRLVGETFGAAISLGNTLVNLLDEEDLRKAFRSVHRLLVPGGRFLFQIINYERIRSRKLRHLPLNFREDEKGEVVFLRLLEPVENGIVRFCPTSLSYRPGDDPPVTVVQSRLIEVRGWERREMESALDGTGFQVESVFGDMEGGPYASEDSADLVVLAAKAS